MPVFLLCIIPSSITATINAFLAEAMEKLPEASTMQEATQSVSEDVSADDGTTIKEEEIKPSEGLKKLFFSDYVDYADKLLTKDRAGKSKDRIINLAGIISEWSQHGICVEINNHAPEWAKALKESTKIARSEFTITKDLRNFVNKKETNSGHSGKSD